MIAAGAALVVSLLLPWYSESPPPGAFYAKQSYSAFASFAVEDWVLLLAGLATILCGLRLRALLRLRHWHRRDLDGLARALLLISGVAAAIVLVRIVALPAPATALAAVGVQFGAFVALFATLTGLGAAIWTRRQLQVVTPSGGGGAR